MFSGVEFLTDTGGGECVKFTLDDVTYCVVEDPDDGYRSYMGDIYISDTKPRTTFEPQKVIVTAIEDGIQLLNPKTSKTILMAYTADLDDWYPCCIFNYHPENMEINKERN